MRREWSVWIKTRQWSEFEKLAKVEPSQSLADTIAELELGFPDKPDRRALRKILFLLAQAGYEPREIEETVDDRPKVGAPFSVAFMVSPDGSGDTVFTVGREEKGRVVWLITARNLARRNRTGNQKTPPRSTKPKRALFASKTWFRPRASQRKSRSNMPTRDSPGRCR